MTIAERLAESPRPKRSAARLRLRLGQKKAPNVRSEDNQAVALRRSHRVALGSLVLSLVVALLSTGTSYVSMRSSERQSREALAASERQEDENFRRTNQRVAYAEFQIVIARLNIGIVRFTNLLAADQIFYRPLPELKTSLQTLIDGMTPMNDKYAVVQIVATVDTLDLAEEWIDKTIEAVWLTSGSITFSDAAYSVDKSELKVVATRMDECARLQARFLEGARHDVNAYG